jgi:hypothetical protein
MKKFTFFFAILFISCNSQKPCKFGKPEPLFSKNTPLVSDYHFESKGQNANEHLRLDSLFATGKNNKGENVFMPIELEIIQAGCEEVVQEFRIEFFDKNDKMPSNFSAPDCANIIIQIFAELCRLGTKAMTFQGLAQAILEKETQFIYGKAISMKNGFSIQLDKMQNPETTLVSVILKNSAE